MRIDREHANPPAQTTGIANSAIRFLAIAVAFSLLVSYELYQTHRAAEQSAKNDASNLTLLLESKLNADLSAAERTVSAMVAHIEPEAMRPASFARNRARIDTWLRENVADITSASALRYFDAEGNALYASSTTARQVNIADMPHFQDLKRNPGLPIHFSEVTTSRSSGRVSMFVSKAVRAPDGAFLGITSSAIDIEALGNYFRSVDLGKEGTLALRRLDNGAAVARFPAADDSINKPLPNLPARLAILTQGPIGTLDPFTSPVDRITRIFGYRKIGEFPFYIAAGLSENDYLADWKRSSGVLLVGAALFLALLAIAEWRNARYRANLRESEERFRHLTALSADWFWEQDEHYRFTFISTGVDVQQRGVGEHLGKTRWELPHIDTDPALIRENDALLAARKPFRNLVIRRMGKDGRVHYAQISGEPVFDATGRFTGYRGVGSDITERMELEQRVQAAAAEIEDLYEHAPCGYHSLGPDGIYRRVNATELEWLGCTRDEAVGHLSPVDFFAPESQALFRKCFAELVQNKSVEPYAVDLIGRNGIARRVSVSATAITDAAGRFLMSRTVMFDISELRAAQDLLLRTLREKDALLENELVGIMAARQRTIVWANPAFEKLFGYEPGEAVGKDTRLGYPSEEAYLAFGAAAYAKLGAGEIFRNEVELVRKDGGRIWAEISGASLDSESGESLWTFVDVTERKRAGEQLLAARTMAESANRAKSEFLANMSHEIRTPLNGLLGNLQLLEMTQLDAEQKDFLSAMMQSGKNLLSLINDILDLSKIEAEKIVLEHADFSLRACVNNVLLTQRARIASKKLSLKLSLGSEVPDSLVGDELRVKQILLNLIGNAIKFTDAGEIAVSVGIRERQGDLVLVEFAVADTGIGIPATALERVFDPFVQADSATPRQFGGTGLGLAICRRLTELMGGSIAAESVAGAGSTFRVLLPFGVIGNVLRGPDEERVRGRAHWFGPAVKILLVEDNAISLEVGATLLRKMGHQVTTAANGEQALASLSRDSFDLVLMDIRMPVMNGEQALLELRRRESGAGGRLPVIAVTAHALKGDAERLLAAGFDGYVAKPLQVEKLVEEMKRVLGRAAALA